MTHIVGAGAHGRDIAALMADVGYCYRLWDDNEAVAGAYHFIEDAVPGYYLVGLNDPHARERMAKRLDALSWVPRDALLHNSAHIGNGCRIGDGGVVGPLSSLLTEVTTGLHTHIGAGCHLTRATLGDFVTVAPGAVICGDVTIGDRTFIGAGAVVKNLVTIGSDVTVGCGAVVVADVPNGATVVGVPAKVTEPRKFCA